MPGVRVCDCQRVHLQLVSVIHTVSPQQRSTLLTLMPTVKPPLKQRASRQTRWSHSATAQMFKANLRIYAVPEGICKFFFSVLTEWF